MKTDIRASVLYREAESIYQSLRQPGSGQISDAAEIHVSPDAARAVFSGAMVTELDGFPPTRICQVELATGDTQVLTFGPNTDRSPKYSPDGRTIAFLSDRENKGDFQLFLLDRSTGEARATPRVTGWVEYLHWSPNGKAILLAAASHGADTSSHQGAVASKQVGAALPAWTPSVATGDESFRWRRLWVYELSTRSVRQVDAPQANMWEAVWCGNDAFAAVVSPGPGEGLWYSARLCLIDAQTGECRELYKPADQLGWPAASASGEYVAIVEAVCSDRWIVAGELKLIEISSGGVRDIDTRGIDITYTEWRSDERLLVAGHRGFETVTGLYDVGRDSFVEKWVARDITAVGRYASVSGFNEDGDCVLVGESFTRAPEVALIRGGEYQSVRAFDVGYMEAAKVIGDVEEVTWEAPDGLRIEGWLLTPDGAAPYPLIVNVHGGPVWQWRPTCLGRNAVPILMLLKRGYAVLFSNPRGSTGRGQKFARRVVGDMGGAETTDHLSGIDHLIARGIVNAEQIGIIGGSHGGFMSSWLITQRQLAAAVALSPVNNWVTEYLLSNVPDWPRLFLKDAYWDPSGHYFERSPIMNAHKVRTPMLTICGALDRSTPPEEAVQFHNALLLHGLPSVLVTYPEEGHGVRKLPAMIDFAARVVGWFEMHIRKIPDALG